MGLINKQKQDLLSYDTLVSLLRYDLLSGEFYWIKARGPHKAGAKAGNLQTNGYRQIRINGKLYLEHRLAWFYVHKVWPEDLIDHIDGDSSNNSISNLREASMSQNLQNISLPRHNTSGVKGVSFNKQKQKYEAYISIHNVKENLGLYDTLEEAHLAYISRVNTTDRKEFNRK